MYLIVAGAGRIGRSLVELAVADGHDVVVIDVDEEKAADLSSNYDCLVLNADATTNETLQEAGVDRADAVIATTDDDAVNIMVMLLAGEYEVPSRLSVVNRPEQLPIFEKIGVNVIRNPHRLIAENLYHAVEYPSVGDFIELDGETDLIEVTVDAGAAVEGLTLAEAKSGSALPPEALAVAIRRGEQFVRPDGTTEFTAGDTVEVLVTDEIIDAVLAAFEAG